MRLIYMLLECVDCTSRSIVRLTYMLLQCVDCTSRSIVRLNYMLVYCVVCTSRAVLVLNYHCYTENNSSLPSQGENMKIIIIYFYYLKHISLDYKN